MKKFIPLILLFIGLLVFVGIYFVSKNRNVGEDEEETVPEVALELRPIASLTPTEDGHWLNLRVKKLVIDAQSMDYELLYQLPDGRTQGVPGTVQLEGQDMIDRKLLLGSESSGKFRYDEGVEQGTLTLRFRNKKGKLVAKFSTEFSLQNETDLLKSADEVFSYQLEEVSDNYYVVMNTFGLPKVPDTTLLAGPYGVFSSSTSAQKGKVAFKAGGKYFRFDKEELIEIENENSSDIGIFIAVGE